MTQRVVNGVHLPNFRQWNIEQALRAAGPTGAVTILHEQMFNDPMLGGHNADDENENWLLKLREGFQPQGIPAAPERLVHIRMFHPDWRLLAPVKWAEHTAELLANWKGSRTHAGQTRNLWDDPFVAVSLANEQNIEPQWDASMQTADWYDRIGIWNIAAVKRLDELIPKRKALLVSPAFAPGHEPFGTVPDAEYKVPAVVDMLHAYDVVGIHSYALLNVNPESAPGGKEQYWYMLRPFRPKGFKDDTDIGGILAQYPRLTYLVSEAGTFTHIDKAKTDVTWAAMDAFLKACAASGNIVGCTWFIWNSSPSSHPENIIWDNDKLREKLEKAPRYETTAPIPVRGTKPVPVPPPPLPPPPPGGSMEKLLAAELGDKFRDLRALLPDIDGQYGRFNTRPLNGINYLAIHHSATSADTTARAIYDFHIGPQRGWSGVGYHFLVWGDGVVAYVGDISTSRANVADRNDEIVGVCFIGTFTDTPPTDAALSAGARLVKVLRAYLGRQVPLAAHRALNPGTTECPGNALVGVLGRLEAVPVAPVVDYAKVVYFLETAQRAAEAEGLKAVSAYIAQHYTADAVKRRDAV